MESVREALNRARTMSIMELKAKTVASVEDAPHQFIGDPFQVAGLRAHVPSRSDLKEERVVAFDAKDPRTRIFDLLRNALLASVEAGASRVIAATAPSHGCGVSTLAVNLAFSIARKRQWQVVVATLDAASTLDRLGVRGSAGDSCDVEGAATDKLEIEGSAIYLSNLDSLHPEAGAHDAARPALVRDWIDRVRRKSGPTVFILDLPPLPMNDDGAAVIPLADSALVVVGMGVSTTADLESCRSMLAHTPHHVILNKARPHGL